MSATAARHVDLSDTNPITIHDSRPDELNPHVVWLAEVNQRAWDTIAGRYWSQAAAMRAVYGPGPVRDGLRALPLLEQLAALHQPRAWAEGSETVVCSCGQGAYPCPTARVLRGQQ